MVNTNFRQLSTFYNSSLAEINILSICTTKMNKKTITTCHGEKIRKEQSEVGMQVSSLQTD